MNDDSRNISNGRPTGATLLEVLTVMMIVSILATIAVPSFISMLKKWEANQTRNQIINTYRVAKTKSFIHRNHTTVCIANSQLLCHRDAQDFLLVFNDNNNNRLYEAAQDVLIQSNPLNLDYGRVYLRAGNKRHYIKFSGDTGMPRGHYAHIKYCPDDADISHMYQISLNEVGRHRFKPYAMKVTDCP